uniref:Uncharacterized protein n=1 Tax=Panagrolaimus superbus TaxID=310955 RepID=A0A914YJS7_9BILA
MAEVTTTTTPPLAENAPVNATDYKPKLEEQMLAYASIYTMALICVIWGSIRSLKYVKKTIAKKRLIDASILTSDAKKFPINASLVLFTLYLVFKGNAIQDGVALARTHVLPNIPETYHHYFDTVVDYLPKANGTQFSWRDKVNNYYPSLEPYVAQVPEITKQNFVTFLVWLMTYEGVCCLATLLKPIISFVLRLLPIGDRWPRRNISYYLVFKSGKKEMEEGDIEDAKKDNVNKYFEMEFDDHWIWAFLAVSIVGVLHITHRHWITNNIIAVSFSIMGIEMLHVASFKAGAILLFGLFFYDIFWVFGTDVMTTVAKSIDAPILLMFPQDLLAHGWQKASKHGMLGLGDIVIPGIFIALLRRFDAHIFEKDGSKQKSRYYFAATMVAYTVGLFATIAIMHHFKAAQPALLYLVPACLITPLTLALIRGEFSQLWNYSEEHITERFDSIKKAEKEKIENANQKKNKQLKKTN